MIDLVKGETLIYYNLQLFAEDGGEKTEKPTSKKREKAREEGQVAKSNEVTTTLMLVAMFSAIKLLGPYTIDRLLILYKEIMSLFSVGNITIEYAQGLYKHIAMKTLIIVLPYLGIAFVIAFLSNIMQVGWKPTLKPMQPKLDKLNPVSGLKRMFSLKTIVELIKSIIKILVILIIVYLTIKDYERLILIFYDLPVYNSYGMIINICLDIGIKVGMFFVFVAGIDYAYQKYSLEKKLKMSKQEVKQEHKESEGNPEIKAKIRQKMREASMRRMMQDVPDADVIITNPTHFAVAIKYDEMKSAAPIVIAKGADLLAARIKEKARENNIEIVENKPLARTLYYTVDIGDEIPPELYQTVAELLAFVYNLKHGEREGARS
jgi:flagellar biosynthetic protein FlhB